MVGCGLLAAEDYCTHAFSSIFERLPPRLLGTAAVWTACPHACGVCDEAPAKVAPLPVVKAEVALGQAVAPGAPLHAATVASTASATTAVGAVGPASVSSAAGATRTAEIEALTSPAAALAQAKPATRPAAAAIKPTAATVARMTALCARLAPAVAVRPAPAGSLSAYLVVSLSPWRWADSAAELTFNPDGIEGALATPWGEGRWGPMPRKPAVLWATFSGRTHMLRVHGALLESFRCGGALTAHTHPHPPTRASHRLPERGV